MHREAQEKTKKKSVTARFSSTWQDFLMQAFWAFFKTANPLFILNLGFLRKSMFFFGQFVPLLTLNPYRVRKHPASKKILPFDENLRFSQDFEGFWMIF